MLCLTRSLPRPAAIVFFLAFTLGGTTAARADSITLGVFSTGYNNPIGIDYSSFHNALIVSHNYSTGVPSNLELVNLLTGAHAAYSPAAGFDDEIKVATARTAAGGFLQGETFTGNGADGQIAKISPDGTVVDPDWVILPDAPGGGPNGLLRGGLFVDNTGVWGNDLIAVTNAGEVWRVNSLGVATNLLDLVQNVHFEGVSVIPNNASWGDYAGSIIVGVEDQSFALYIIDPVTGASTVNFGNVDGGSGALDIEDIDLIEANATFYGVEAIPGNNLGQLLSAGPSNFLGSVGHLLLTIEEPTGTTPSGLWELFYDPATLSLQVERFTLNAGEVPNKWEHVTFAPGVVTVPDPNSSLLLLGTGLIAIAGFARKRKQA